YGYTSFYYDLTPYLKLNNENVIAVRVDNSRQTNCRWYSGSGIYRHVYLYVTDPVYIDDWGVAITASEVSSERALIRIKTVIKNKTPLQQQFILSIQISDKKTNMVGSGDVDVELPADNEKEVVQTISVKNPLLWSPETPVLYYAKIKIMRDNKKIDGIRTTFGIRYISFSSEKGFQLNGKPVKLNGGCLHHDNGCLGAAAFDRAEVRKVELMKSAGFNAVRTSHNPPSPAFLDACDSLGLMVIDEAFDGWKESKVPHDYSEFFDDWWKRDLESMVKRDCNHPSIIIWSIGNEIIERTKPEAVQTAKMLAGYIHQTDSTRPVTSAMTTWDQGWEVFDPLMAQHDICGYNYQIQRAFSDHKRVPSRIIVQTESYPRDAFSNWDIVQNNNYIVGDFVWTARDYLGESGIGRYYYPGEPDGEFWQRDMFPWHGAYCGDIDLIGWRKPISHYRNILWNGTEKLYMAVKEPNPDNGEIKETQWSVWPAWESWTWPGLEGKDLQVEVYSKYPEVRLYLNDKLIEEKPTAKDQEYKAIFNIKYSPGLLKAVGLKDNKEIESTILKTAGNPAGIKLTADRNKIIADGQDLSFVAVQITDEEGNIQPNADNKLLFTLDGPGIIAGLSNANLKDSDQYAGNSLKAWHGRALVVVRSTHNTGEIILKVTSPGLTDADTIIKSVK
ncbi:MAG TPA: glycoside hydrolase family 2 TIM barrel-domain containing protein, partial [Ignavibacteriaceae bacterium]|nr:glycoside hydrolase family 2 TIM barrel-domain containing protein [Ignavibacteriaceae bacterium]